ncbi:substrate-binding protein [Hoeflea prorocentri]|uniref:Substrate-binding protein n=1 Tax=Hoeflea prorocentri TaxID=1922333 RepID=A0A9X3UEW2_9HYPH|nr:substrate-binding protein [Hoeflea prorocentri]MCY6379358.1 substrate-binding protein [Hoeflea prorocentri]MDA5397159.1 substrate-binding protein [Hoeflea prorocentri]
MTDNTKYKGSIGRRSVLKAGSALAAAGIGTLAMPSILRAAEDKIKIGFHSGLTGLETLLGETQVNCFKMAVDEINAAGGAAGREIEYLIEDNQTSTRGAIDKTRKFIQQDNVDVIIGMITSLERSAALSVSVPAKKLVIYPTYYEGGECERYLACTGQIPNQSVDPFVPWIEKNVGTSVYIIGSDYGWPRETAKAISAAFEKSGSTTLGTEFFPFGTQDFGPALDRVRAAKPDVVWELCAGADALTFLKQFASFKPGGQLLTNGLDELFTTAMDGADVEGIIVNQSYFSSLDTEANKTFLANYRSKYGADRHVNSIAESTYVGTWLYAKAVDKAGTTDTEKVIDAMAGLKFGAPQGEVTFDGTNNHLAVHSIIGRCRNDGLYDIIEDFGAITPSVPGCNLT